MRLKRFFSAALSAALLVSLCACAPKETAGSGDPTASGSYSGPRFSIPGFMGSLFGNSSEPASPPPPEYDKEHRLAAAIPELVDGLETPVSGATGYTSVELPLWPSNPGPVEDPKAPDPTQPPSEPEGIPDEPPAEADPSAPAPDGSIVPAPGLPAGLEAPAEPSEPPESTPGPVPPEGADPEADPAEAPEAEPEEEPDPYEGAVAVWEPGTAFVILEEDGDWWLVSREDVFGWIEHRYCMINLPDVIPSIIYDDTNSYSSLFVSCGKNIPGVTGEALYKSETLTDNARLGRQEFMMPMLYSAARHICAAQHKALAEGNCLRIYQTFRPYETQRTVVSAMSKLANEDPEVKAGISTPPWSMAWFINTGLSNHQRGFALDVSMVKVYETETAYVGSSPYLRMTDYEDYKMPTDMHELSIAAISTISPSSSQLSETMNEPAIALRGYFTSSGLSPLASEWWHFNDNEAMRKSEGNPSNGRYFITECLSCLPEHISDLLEAYEEMQSLEDESSETESVEDGSTETESVEPEPSETDPLEMSPSEVESFETEPVETEPMETEPVETEPVATEPMETEPSEVESLETEAKEIE